MKYSEGQSGRIFVIRLEDGEILHEQIESFAQEHKITAASLIAVGGADHESKIIVGPEQGRSQVINPVQFILNGVHEITGTGTIFPDKEGNPKLHMHIACGRGAATHTGCARSGVKVWHVLEVILYEITGNSSKRLKDPVSGFELLDPSAK